MIWSGYMDREVELKIKNAGVTAFVNKPFSKHDLAIELRRILEPSTVK